MREPLFIVAPPRSYTSVVGGMLGQHPQAYGLPEVNLSHGDTLGDMWDSVIVAANFGTAGILRLLAEIRYELGIDRLNAAAIERGSRARHMTI